ncbi:aspartokinase [Thecamonas trahens ATCC 50062]|uniref:Aspartokinase n=1 Tax=Thecamonas trahens ATCC 50062 TaxID=461836 RepID=A0A0L0D459_THETB|nr:aspartokinase [Thecamonas trahens ATCC 50062]KNC47142.1 aspartokinase [Thecamonas trahens ATCC 50062]|eukprot:XP_013759918.1 aspartokinase [Thecamonas trahens ATCC 50062]
MAFRFLARNQPAARLLSPERLGGLRVAALSASAGRSAAAHREVMKFGGASLGSADAVHRVAMLVAAKASGAAAAGSGDEIGVVLSAMYGVAEALAEASTAARTRNFVLLRKLRNQIVAGHLETIDALFAPPAMGATRVHAQGESPNAALDLQSPAARMGRTELDALRTTLRSEVEQLMERDFDTPVGALFKESFETPGDAPAVKAQLDRMQSLGERLSCLIFEKYLIAMGTSAVLADPTGLIRTNGKYGAALPDLEASAALIQAQLDSVLAAGSVAVVPGLYGGAVDNPAAITTFNRGGSDLTATLLGRGLGADEVSLWRVEPVQEAESGAFVDWAPGSVGVVHDGDAKTTIPVLTYNEAEVLTRYGKEIVDPQIVSPIEAKEIPIRIRNTLEPAREGTTIVAADDKPAAAAAATTVVRVRNRGALDASAAAALPPSREVIAVVGDDIRASLQDAQTDVADLVASVDSRLGDGAELSAEWTLDASPHAIPLTVEASKANDAIAALTATLAGVNTGALTSINVTPEPLTASQPTL